MEDSINRKLLAYSRELPDDSVLDKLSMDELAMIFTFCYLRHWLLSRYIMNDQKLYSDHTYIIHRKYLSRYYQDYIGGIINKRDEHDISWNISISDSIEELLQYNRINDLYTLYDNDEETVCAILCTILNEPFLDYPVTLLYNKKAFMLSKAEDMLEHRNKESKNETEDIICFLSFELSWNRRQLIVDNSRQYKTTCIKNIFDLTKKIDILYQDRHFHPNNESLERAIGSKAHSVFLELFPRGIGYPEEWEEEQCAFVSKIITGKPHEIQYTITKEKR